MDVCVDAELKDVNGKNLFAADERRFTQMKNKAV
jgi:hypothetical protein